MTPFILGILVAMTAIMTAGWIFQRSVGNGGWTDVFWTYGTGVTCAVAALLPIDREGDVLWRQALVALLIAVWSLRLGTYVAIRVANGAEDGRYATLRRSWGASFQRRMLGLLLVQAPVTAVLGIAILYAAHQPAEEIRAADVAGIAILATSIIGEAIADRQMARFKSDPTMKGAVCDRGLWSWSRHPNYFFEVLGWLAYPVIGFDPANPGSLFAWLAPLLMVVVIRFGTGIPPLEAAMLKSKGDAYRRYQQRVSALFPWPPHE